MRIQQLTLANFRGFEQVELDFERDVTLIAGVNGVGKSGVLYALAVVFSRLLPEFTPSTSKAINFTNEDICYGKQVLDVSAQVVVAEQVCHCGIQRVIESDESGDQWNQFWLSKKQSEAEKQSFADMINYRTLTGDLDAGRIETTKMLADQKAKQQQPIVILFSPRRHLPGRPKALPQTKAFAIANAYGYALHDREVELREIMHWFRVVESGGSTAHRHGAMILDKLREVITSFIPEFSNLHIEEMPTLRFMVEKNGTPLVLNQLSDGERGLLAMLFDITRRLSIANPELADPIGEGTAIILIDEIELHLHPLWQRQVLRRFKEIFRNCQFIATTHSPLVISEVEARCVRFLDRDDKEKIFVSVPSEAYGLDANRVLEEFMGTRVRNQDIDKRLEDLFELIDDEDFPAAWKAIQELRIKLGSNDPELTRASSLIKFLEGAE